MMKAPLFRFFISGEKKEVSMDSDLWKLLLLGDKAWVSESKSSNKTSSSLDITIGDYFIAARKFLSRNDFSLLKKGLEGILNTHIQTKDICRLNLFLEKHGAFYHPLRLVAILQDGNTVSFVINGAISEQGLALVQNEYYIIKTLNEKQSPSYLPAVFGCDMFQRGNKQFGFFLGQWLNGFKEFHISKVNDEKKVVIWNSDGSRRFIHLKDAFPIYKKIAEILTLYYDLETFRQIYPWHHAAGDFIIRKNENGFDIKLITIRGYDDLTDFDPDELDLNGPDLNGIGPSIFILPSLMVFFLNLSLRVRMDRLDGTGDSVMIDEDVLSFVVDGFFAGLDQKGVQLNEPDLKTSFIEFFNQFSLDQIIEMMVSVLESQPPAPSEIELVRKNLISHCKILHAIYNSI